MCREISLKFFRYAFVFDANQLAMRIQGVRQRQQGKAVSGRIAFDFSSQKYKLAVGRFLPVI